MSSCPAVVSTGRPCRDNTSAAASSSAALKGEFGRLCRLRVGRYRIIYEAIHNDLTILVVAIGIGRDAYR